jgi:hypothetical protein
LFPPYDFVLVPKQYSALPDVKHNIFAIDGGILSDFVVILIVSKPIRVNIEK